MVLALNEDLWIIIISYVATTYTKASYFRGISKEFNTFISRILKQRELVEDWDMSLYDVYFPFESFWKGFKNHFPILDNNLSPKDALAFHLLESLKASLEDEERTDQVLFYLAKTKAFEEDYFLQERREEFLNCFAQFATDRLNDPRLFAFTELRAPKAVPPIHVQSFSRWMKLHYGTAINLNWLETQIHRHRKKLKELAKRDRSHGLALRLSIILGVFDNPYRLPLFVLLPGPLLLMLTLLIAGFILLIYAEVKLLLKIVIFSFPIDAAALFLFCYLDLFFGEAYVQLVLKFALVLEDALYYLCKRFLNSELKSRMLQ